MAVRIEKELRTICMEVGLGTSFLNVSGISSAGAYQSLAKFPNSSNRQLLNVSSRTVVKDKTPTQKLTKFAMDTCV